jgi:S-DNA-T family DNA segregation ATPase FtsK/SpoIIIE
MAKKKKTTKAKTRKRTKKVEDASPKTVSYFWRQVFAFALIIFAIFIFLGGFGMGGKLPMGLFNLTAWLFGFAAFLVPFVLIFLAIHKLRHEEFMIPISKILSSLLFLVALSGALHVVIERDEAAAVAASGTYGGQIGNLVSGVSLSILNEATSFIILLFLAWVGFMLMFGLSPKVLFQKFKNLFIRENDDDESPAEPEHKGFQLNESVPVEHHDKDKLENGPRRSTFKNVAMPLTAEESHAALLTTTDPDWKAPPVTLLSNKQDKADAGDVEGNAEIIKSSLSNFGINVDMEGANVGPRVTQFTLKPPTGVKLSKITALETNLALDLAATSIRMEAPIPGKRAVGIEVPNIRAATVRMRSLLQAPEMVEMNSPLGFVIGKDIAGKAVVADLAKMPHLLVAGQTGSGKSVMINVILNSLLFRNSPADLKLILVDPKHVEMGTYNDLPHLLTPVITEPEKCISALKWAVAEMERRLRTMAEYNTSNIKEYNDLKKEEGMPYIVIVIDELADLMMMAARDVEALIARIAQKARAAGIHLVLATQRPSVNVITGLIKANVPARIAFTTVSQIDSRTIIDQQGAESLLGMGDMLFSTTEMAKPRRVQGALIEKPEVIKVTDFIKEQRKPDYNDEVVSMPVVLNGKGGIVPDTGAAGSGGSSGDDDVFRDAVQVVIDGGKASTSLLQRRLRIGYGRASRIIDEMEERGIIGAADGSRPREVLVRSVSEAMGDDNVGAASSTQIEVSDDPRDEYLTR